MNGTSFSHQGPVKGQKFRIVRSDEFVKEARLGEVVTFEGLEVI